MSSRNIFRREDKKIAQVYINLSYKKNHFTNLKLLPHSLDFTGSLPFSKRMAWKHSIFPHNDEWASIKSN